jgi:hypothetical protein
LGHIVHQGANVPGRQTARKRVPFSLVLVTSWPANRGLQ